MENNNFNCVATHNASDVTYYYHQYGLGYDQANEHCKNIYNGNLAVINDDDTLSNIIDGFSIYSSQCNRHRDYLRIGLQKNTDGLFNWADGSKYKPNPALINTANQYRCSNSHTYTIYQSVSLNKVIYGCSLSNKQLAYICQKTTEKVEPKTTGSAVIAVYTAVLILVVIILMIVLFMRNRQKLSKQSTKQTTNIKIERKNEIYETSQVPLVNVSSVRNDPEYATIEKCDEILQRTLVSPVSLSQERDPEYATIDF